MLVLILIVAYIIIVAVIILIIIGAAHVEYNQRVNKIRDTVSFLDLATTLDRETYKKALQVIIYRKKDYQTLELLENEFTN